MHRSSLRSIVFVLIAACLTACGSMTSGSSGPSAVVPRQGFDSGKGLAARPDGPYPPGLVTMNHSKGDLEMWPLQRGGGSHPFPISINLGLGYISALAANGHLVIMADQTPASVALYGVISHKLRILPDPFGTPIDVAVGKDGTIYAINIARSSAPVTMYAPPSHRPVELNCTAVTIGQAIAVDNEGDIFVQGYGSGSSGIVAEIPNGPGGPDPQHCMVLPLKTDGGYVAGVAIDPKTDDLLTLDNPDYCAGGDEGRLTIYPKPYNQSTGHSRVLGFVCSSGLRLNADSTVVFIGDMSVDYGRQFILQRSYPDGGDMGIYHGSDITGITTIPNTLPN
jgi:hypothetical protein